MFRGNAARTGEHPGPGPNGTPTVRWQFEPVDEVSSAEVAIGAGTAFLTTYDPDGFGLFSAGYVFAIDLNTGSERWRAEIRSGTDSCPVVVGNDVYVYDGSALLRFNALTGEEETVVVADRLWTEIESSPAVSAGAAYFVSGDGFLYAADIESGPLWKWRFPIGPIPSSPSVVGDTLYVAGYGVIKALDTSSGELRWSLDLPTIIRTTPAVVGGYVYVGGDDGNLYAIG